MKVNLLLYKHYIQYNSSCCCDLRLAMVHQIEQNDSTLTNYILHGVYKLLAIVKRVQKLLGFACISLPIF